MSVQARAAAILVLVLSLVVGGAINAQTAEPTAEATSAATAEPNVGRQAFTVDLGDFQTPAEITYPPDATGPFPTVVLIAGSGPADMDVTIYSSGGSGVIVSQIFRDIANFLPQHGYAVVRFNKHYVTSASQIDTAKFATLDLNQMLADAQKVVETARSNPLVDPKQLFVYGWSEGSTVAAALAANHPGEFAGLIVQGAVTQSWRALVDAQFNNYSIPYLKSFAPDGRITADTIKQAMSGNGGLVAKNLLSLLVANHDPQGTISLNPAFDTNGDGAISLADELPAALKTTLDAAFAPGGDFNLYAPDKALPSVAGQAAKLTLPVLILQGERDANVDPNGAIDLAGKLAAAGNHDFHVILYPTLGHSLGEVNSAMEDTAPPIAPQPLADLASWLNKETGVNAGVAVTAEPTP